MTDRQRLAFVRWLMFITVLLTASPIVLLANRIEPFVLGMPFFLFWCSATPFILFALMHWYGRIAERVENA